MGVVPKHYFGTVPMIGPSGVLQFYLSINYYISRGGFRTSATSKIDRFLIIISGFQPLNIITKCSILDVTGVLDPPLISFYYFIAVPIRETCSKSLMRFNSHIFYILFYFTAALSKFSQCFKVFIFNIDIIFN